MAKLCEGSLILHVAVTGNGGGECALELIRQSMHRSNSNPPIWYVDHNGVAPRGITQLQASSDYLKLLPK